MLVYVINSHGCILFIFVVILLTVSVSRVLIICYVPLTCTCGHGVSGSDYCRSIDVLVCVVY